MIGIVLSLALVAWVISLPLSGGLARYGRRLGLVDRAGLEAHKLGGRSVCDAGGVAIFVAVCWPMAAMLLAVLVVPDDWWGRALPWVQVHLPGLRRAAGVGGAVLVAASLMHALGVVDDRRGLSPWLKLTAQLLIAAGLVWAADMRVLHLLDTYGGIGVAGSVAVTVLWIVVVVNAVNFMDNMDGLAGGVAAVAAGVYLAATLIGGEWFVAALAALLFGALAGFLVFNVAPARLYLGDGGSLLVGLLLAVISIRTTYFLTVPALPEGPAAAAYLQSMGTAGGPHIGGAAAGATRAHWYGLLTPLVVLAVPLYDFVTVCLLRLRAGRSPLVGDRNHFSHRLVRQGYSKRRAVGVIWLCTLATGLSGVMLGSLEAWQACLAALQTVAVLAVLAALER